ncbi:hypothetical protein P43SY_004132 [Pythium insidiosum]|uniref:Transmembrane protein n=1 Tax=Pythium insidiosum TaxID=114742 RepID=A0AAD5LZE1_PYTIN|nr:hypothetical protein P43SY_004132 [Pythium insidiosum]
MGSASTRVRKALCARRSCVLLALAMETISLAFGPIKDFVIWQYPATLFKQPLTYSSELLENEFRTTIDGITVVNQRGLETIAIEFPNLRLAAELATLMGYDYNAENTALLPAVCNSVEAYLCLVDESYDELFFEQVQRDPSQPLNSYLHGKRASDPAYLSKLFLPQHARTVSVCQRLPTLEAKVRWLTTDGSLHNAWPRVTFDSVADLLLSSVKVVGALSSEDVSNVRSSKFEYPGRSYVYDDPRAKWNIFGRRALTVNVTKRVSVAVATASRTYSWRRRLLTDWYYHGVDRDKSSASEDFRAHNFSACVFRDATRAEIATHRVKRYSLAAAAEFTGCNPRTTDCSQVLDINDVRRWNGAVFNAWTEVKMPQPIYPREQLFHEVTSFEEFILAIRDVISYPLIAVDMDNSFARPTAETTQYRNYVLADIAGIEDGALPFLTETSLAMGQLEPFVGEQQAKNFYLQNFRTPRSNMAVVGRVIFARARRVLIPYLPFEPSVNQDLKSPLMPNFVSLHCAWDRGYGTSLFYTKVRNQHGECVQRLGPTIGNSELVELINDLFFVKYKDRSDEELVQAVDARLTQWETTTNTSIDLGLHQSVAAGKYPRYFLSPGLPHRITASRMIPFLFGRGPSSRHVPANAYLLNSPAGLRLVTRGFYRDVSVEGAFKMMTFVSIATSFLTALYTISVIIVPVAIAVTRAPPATLRWVDLKALFAMDLACASYSTDLLLPFNVFSGLIPVMRVLTFDDVRESSGHMVAVASTLLGSWRFAVAVLQVCSSVTPPSRHAWGLTLMVTGTFFLARAVGLGRTFETYSRSIFLTVFVFVVDVALAYPAIRWYSRRNTVIIRHSSINALVNRAQLRVSNAALVPTATASSSEAKSPPPDQPKAIVIGNARGDNSTKSALSDVIEGARPSLAHALEAAARHKCALWVNFQSHSVESLWLRMGSTTEGVVRPDAEPSRNNTFAPIEIA